MAQKREISSLESAFSEAVLLLREYSHRLNSELNSALSVISRAVARSATNEAKCALVAVKCQLFSHAQLHHAFEMPKHSDRLDAVVDADVGRRSAQTTVSGFVALRFGAAAGFYVMTGVALIAVAICWAFMLETKVTPAPSPSAGKRGGWQMTSGPASGIR
jgi:hypothetical protein